MGLNTIWRIINSVQGLSYRCKREQIAFFDGWFGRLPHIGWMRFDFTRISTQANFVMDVLIWLHKGTGNVNKFLLWISEVIRCTASCKIAVGLLGLLLVGWWRVGHLRTSEVLLSLSAFYIPVSLCFLNGLHSWSGMSGGGGFCWIWIF